MILVRHACTLCVSVRRAGGAKSDRLFSPSAPKANWREKFSRKASIALTSQCRALFYLNCAPYNEEKKSSILCGAPVASVHYTGEKIISCRQLCASASESGANWAQVDGHPHQLRGPSAMTQHQTPPRALLLSARCRKWKSELYAPKACTHTPADAICTHFFFQITHPEQIFLDHSIGVSFSIG